MTPFAWLRHGSRTVPAPAPLAEDVLARLRAITHPQPAAPLDPVRATVLRLTREEQAEPARYSEADDEIGGSKRHSDGEGDW